MRRITISVDDDLAETFESLVHRNGYENRSEAFRDLLRNALEREQLEGGESKHCVGTLSYVYNHHERQLASRLTEMQHAHHDVTVSTMHAHLDHDDCIETVILRGRTVDVMTFARAVIATKGVRHGRFHPISVEADSSSTRHMHSHPHS